MTGKEQKIHSKMLTALSGGSCTLSSVFLFLFTYIHWMFYNEHALDSYAKKTKDYMNAILHQEHQMNNDKYLGNKHRVVVFFAF